MAWHNRLNHRRWSFAIGQSNANLKKMHMEVYPIRSEETQESGCQESGCLIGVLLQPQSGWTSKGQETADHFLLSGLGTRGMSRFPATFFTFFTSVHPQADYGRDMTLRGENAFTTCASINEYPLVGAHEVLSGLSEDGNMRGDCTIKA